MTRGSVKSDVMAGAVGAVIVFPIILNCGSVVSQPLGADYVVTGIGAAFAASVMVSLLRGLAGGAPLHLVSPKATYAAMVAALLVTTMKMAAFQDAFPDPGQRAGVLVTLSFLCAALAGVFQLLLGLGRAGTFVKFIPYPVIAGFINGFAVTLLLGQAPGVLGEADWAALGRALNGAQRFPFGAAALGISTCLITLAIPRVIKRGPSALWGLAIGTGLYWAMGWVRPDIALGGRIGVLPPALPVHPQFGALLDLAVNPVFGQLLSSVVATAVMLALIASLQSLLSISAADALLGTRHDSNRELILQGAGNILSGLSGGMPTGGSPSVTRMVLDSGGRGRAANLSHAVVLALLAMGLGHVIGLIPTAVMAAVVVASTFNQMDDWSRRLLKRFDRKNFGLMGNLGLVLAVTVLVVAFGVLPALAAGMTLSFAVFVRHASHTIVRRTIWGEHLRSRTARPATIQAALRELSSALVLVEVQGPIFFGSADQLTRHLEDITTSERFLILDLKRVVDIDGSGVVALNRLDEVLDRRGCRLLLAYVAPDGPTARALADMGCARLVRDQRLFIDSDAALTWAEDELLRQADRVPDDSDALALADFDIVKGIGADGLAKLEALLEPVAFPAFAAIVVEGESGDSFYLLVSGRVVVSRRIEGRILRFASSQAGISFGEMGMLTGHLRAADITAETDVRCWKMEGARFRALCQADPALGLAMVTNIAIGLSDLAASLSDLARELER